VTAIVGPPHSGKSLLLAAIVGKISVLEGAILVAGRDPVKDRQAVRRRISFVPKHSPLLSHLTALELVQLLLSLTHSSRISDAEVIKALRLAELPDRLLRERAGVLTQIDRLRIWLAIHGLRRTPILIVDEPASDLPAAEGREAARLLREAAAGDRAVVLTAQTHDFASGIADDAFEIVGSSLKRKRSPTASGTSDVIDGANH
jgi:ABC-2 type transport system ATP-binding protein